MPGGDRTGPEGKGSMTGRGQGLCSGSETPGRESDAVPRRGLGRGNGRGFRNIFKATGKTLTERNFENEDNQVSAGGMGRGAGRGRRSGTGRAAGGWYGSRRRPGPFVPSEVSEKKEEK